MQAASGADRLTVLAVDGDGRRAWRLAVLEIRPQRLRLIERFGILGGMLDRKEQRRAVRREARTGRFAPSGQVNSSFGRPRAAPSVSTLSTPSGRSKSLVPSIAIGRFLLEFPDLRLND